MMKLYILSPMARWIDAWESVTSKQPAKLATINFSTVLGISGMLI